MNRAKLSVLLSGIASLLFASQASAITIYTYTGSTYDSSFIDNAVPLGSYTTSMRVTGSISLASPLAANLVATSIVADLLSFSFSDGRVILTDSNSSFSSFTVSTDSASDISDWHFRATEPFVAFVGDQGLEIISDFGTGDDVILTECTSASGGFCTGATGDGASASVAGSFVTSTVPIPEPSTALLLAGGLLGLAVRGRIGAS